MKSSFPLKPNQLNRLLAIAKESDDTDAQKEIHSRESSVLKDKSDSKLPDWIGRYKITRMLGEGGMGIVYQAVQEHPVKRTVALKVIKPGMDSMQVIIRFENELQTLALLDHPNIAHVFDAGTTEEGRPYFVMEYVPGLPITDYCDNHKLNVEDRLDLFLLVCDAVQHAHQKGIIHRDIKPSNILVSNENGQAIPKIIDFGVAKAIIQPLTERTLITEESHLLGTLEYMSPEQVEITNEDIDTRSDIYSLGVLLYELLTGVLPFDSETLRTGGIEHIRQVIRETDPRTPSTRLIMLGDEATAIAYNRRMEINTLARHLRKELEWIPLKAMRKDRSERYRSASEIADDIKNYLKGAPLIAGPPSTVYKLRKYVRRHSALFMGIIAVLVVLVAGIVVATMLAIGQARTRAEAQAVSEFLRFSVLESLDPFKVGGRQVTIRTVLDTASKDLQGKFQDMPMAEAEIRHTIGFAYWSLGLYKQAELHQSHALEIYRIHLGAEHPMTLAWMKNLGWVYFHWSRYREAERLFTEALQGTLHVFGEEDAATLDSMSTLLMVYYMQGRFDEAEQLYFRAVASAQHTSDEEQLWGGGLSWGYTLQGRYSEAERLAIIALEPYRRKQGGTDYITLQLTRNLGELYWKMGRYNKAEELLRGATNSWRDAWGDEHPETLWTTTSLGWLCYSQGKLDEAQSLFDKTLKIARRVVSEEHFVTAQSMHGLGTVYLDQGLYDRAEPLLTNAWSILCRILSEENWASLSVKNTLGKLYTAQGHYVKAEELYIETMETRRRKLGEDHPGTLETMNDLGVVYKEQARYDEAEELFLEAVEGRIIKLGDQHPNTQESLNNLIDLYEAWNKPEKAEQWRAKLQD